MFKIAHPFIVSVLSVVALLNCPASHAEWVEWLADASVSGQFDSNINRSFSAAKQREDYLGTALLSAGRAYQFGEHSRIYLTAEWDGESYRQHDKLNQQRVGGKGVLTHKFGLGWQAPILRLDVAGKEIFSDSRLRSGRQFSAGLGLSSWCNEFLQGFIGYRFDDRNSDEVSQHIWNLPNSVFDLQGHTLEIGNNLVLSGRWQLNVGYSHRWGGITSNNASANWSRYSLGNVDAVVRDDAFPGWTYRAQGETNQVNLGLSYALLAGHASAAVNYGYLDTEALGRTYQSHQVQVSINYSY